MQGATEEDEEEDENATTGSSSPSDNEGSLREENIRLKSRLEKVSPAKQKEAYL